MATPWPANIPTWDSWEVNGYSERDPYNVVTAEPEAGFYLSRKRFSAMPRRVSGTMIFTAAELATLKTFYSQMQANRFSWNDARGAVRYYQFAGPIEISARSGLYFRVSLDLWEFTTEFGGV